MKTRANVLNSILHTTQMGQLGIRSVLDQEIRPALKKALVQQLQEYDHIEKQTLSMMKSRRMTPKNLSPMLPASYRAITQARLLTGDKNTKIASMMVSGNNRGLVKTMRTVHDFSGRDPQVLALSQQLCDTQAANMEQMRPFL